jgi:hypothetical protein
VDIVVFVFFMATSLSSLADTPPPRVPFDATTWNATLEAKPSLGMRMGSFFVRLEKTTLDDVRRACDLLAFGSGDKLLTE